MPIYSISRSKHRVTIWYRGKRQHWVVNGTKKEAEAFEARKRTELEVSDPAANVRVVPTLSDFFAKYRAHATQRLKARTLTNRDYQLATLKEIMGHLKLNEITFAEVDRFQGERTKSGVKSSTVNDDLKVLRAVLSYARALGYPVPEITNEDLPTRGVKQRNADAWTDAEVGKLYEAVTDHAPEVLPLVVALANTGCRKGEVLACEWSWVDFGRRIIRILPNDDWQPKDGEAREVPISDALLPWLQRLRKSDRWVFPCRTPGIDREKEAWGRYAYWPQRQFDRARKAAGLIGGPHKLRHTFATHFLAANPDVYLLARVLGNSPAMVQNVYGHLLPSHLERARNVVNLAPGVGPAALDGRRRGIGAVN